jgi:hypothetical protein
MTTEPQFTITHGGRVLAVTPWANAHASIANIFAACQIDCTMWRPCQQDIYEAFYGPRFRMLTPENEPPRSPAPGTNGAMRFLIGVLAVLAIAVGVMCARTATIASAGSCAEDAPCWVWSTMGNHKRSVATRDGAWHVVVGPCRFARLAHGDYIDWSRTPHLRGDWTARRIGCKHYRPIAPESIY